MKRRCYLCEEKLSENEECQFFPEDDSYICKECLSKNSN